MLTSNWTFGTVLSLIFFITGDEVVDIIVKDVKVNKCLAFFITRSSLNMEKKGFVQKLPFPVLFNEFFFFYFHLPPDSV